MKKNVRKAGAKGLDHIFHWSQTSPTSATAVEFEQNGGLAISDKVKTALTIVLACDTNDNAYDGHSVTGHYITNAGVKKDFTALYDTGATTTEVAIAADFYCWNLEDYTAATVLVSSIAVQAGDNVYIGTTGMVADAELRLATIAAAATYPVITTLFGAGDVYGLEETNTAGDVGKVVTLGYWTPWGHKKEGNFTLAVNTTTIVRITDSTTGYPVLDFYRRYSIETTGAVGKYVAIGYDADKRVGTVAIDVFYGIIEEGNYESVHSRRFVPASAYGKLYIGDIQLTEASKDYPIVFYIQFQEKTSLVQEQLIWNYYGGTQKDVNICMELAPLSEIKLLIADDGAHPVEANVTMRCYETEV